ncbi:DUF2490 domain-containing protein [Mucilaginibacter sp. RS28]|uniref:DUF2490 domain-containing protein n=1 Tax=Mucilaginibacter straminoryzae TaxID=2932774 RepID=A0A9X2BB45_9SPHI|nr:DUF2490 domain-containing protein [Mucilaginibacter straminoryzae]MCJ8211425.1 DUF2490 domain-containing protein [Mucilaginibacter straminoryzae]
MPSIRLLVLLLLLVLVKNSYAQSAKPGTWGIATVILPGNKEQRWGGYAELQGRTDQTYFRKFFYYEVKGGVSYNFDDRAYVLLGTGRYTTYDYRDLGEGPQTTETRFWEQFTSVQFVGRVKFEHRYRVEQRWLNTGYRNRFRYRINFLVPLNHAAFVPKTAFVSVFDEVFFTDKAPNFERNRISAALGYQFNKSLNLQAGWINQFNKTNVATNDKNNMLLMLQYVIQRKKGNATNLPSIKD